MQKEKEGADYEEDKSEFSSTEFSTCACLAMLLILLGIRNKLKTISFICYAYDCSNASHYIINFRSRVKSRS